MLRIDCLTVVATLESPKSDSLGTASFIRMFGLLRSKCISLSLWRNRRPCAPREYSERKGQNEMSKLQRYEAPSLCRLRSTGKSKPAYGVTWWMSCAQCCVLQITIKVGSELRHDSTAKTSTSITARTHLTNAEENFPFFGRFGSISVGDKAVSGEGLGLGLGAVEGVELR